MNLERLESKVAKASKVVPDHPGNQESVVHQVSLDHLARMDHQVTVVLLDLLVPEVKLEQ